MKTANYSILHALMALLISVTAARSAEVEYGFSSTGSMQSARTEHTASLLSNGKVLVAGGNNVSYSSSSFYSSSELYDPAVGTWSGTGALLSTRASHTATVLSSGKVLVTGGLASADGAYLSSSELYDPATGTWSSTGGMSYTRSGHTATLLGNGKVLVAGGVGNLSSAELYNPTTGQWTATGSMTSPRTNHTATLLDNGKVLVTGGDYNGALASAELYDPTAGTWTAVASMSFARSNHAATKMANGKVLVVGAGTSFTYQYTDIYDPTSGSWTTSTDYNYYSGTKSKSILLPNGKIWLYSIDLWNRPSAQVYDPVAESWLAAGGITPAFNQGTTVTSLTNGKILLAGVYNNGNYNATILYGPVEIPSIQSQPTSVVAGQGGRASFTVTATGVTPAYQWRKNGSDISGATDATYNLANVQYGDAGTYTAVLSNSAGKVTSTPATLTVVAPVTITAQPVNATVNQGGSTTFSVTATGGALTYQWRKRSQYNWYYYEDVIGATDSTLTLNDINISNTGDYVVFISNGGGSVTSFPASLTLRMPLAINSQPNSRTVDQGDNAQFYVDATGDDLSYQWQKNGIDIPEANGPWLEFYEAQTTDAGDYTVVVSDSSGSLTSRVAGLSVIPQVEIINQPTSASANVGESASFSVTATGDNLTYQWAKEGVNIPGAKGATLDLSQIKSADEGDYTVLVSNGQDRETSIPARLTVIGPAAINVQPTSVAVGQGGNAILSVGATGGNLTYQWQRNGIDIKDATEATLEVSNVQDSNLGDYSVIVENSEGSVTSNTVSLSLTDYEYYENEDASGITLSHYIGPA